MAFTEFYCQSGGSNLNSGSTTSNTALYTATNGGWNSGTGVYTPTDGTNPVSAGVAVGQFASVYIDGASVAVFIGRITAVTNAANGTITVSVTIKMGSAPATNASARTIKVGGAWAGPGGSSIFPYTLTGVSSAVNTSSDQVRVNLKNDQTYTFTSGIDPIPGSVTQGYSSTVGDGGKATFTTNVTSSFGFNWTGSGQVLADLIFVNTGASSANDIVRVTGQGSTFIRCVFHGGRGSGLVVNSSGITISAYECEWYDNNKSNTANKAGFSIAAGSALIVNGYSHDNTGSNTVGYLNAGINLTLINSISDTNGGHGVEVTSVTSGWNFSSINSDYYNNTGDAVKLNTGAVIGGWVFMRNNNFIKNGGKGINNTTVGVGQGGLADNNGYGSGSQANGGSDTLGSIISSASVTYSSGVTPWVNPASEDFNINLAQANFAGRGNFTQTDGTSSVTIGHPDIGAAQSLTGAGGAFSKEVSYGSAY